MGMPLTDTERRLIRMAERMPDNAVTAIGLRESLRTRGLPVSPYDSCGRMVDLIEADAAKA